MTSARCPACGAALAAGGQWCTLCFADLRPAVAEPAPVEPAVVPEQLAPMPTFDLDSTALDAPISKPSDVRLAERGWPCPSCGQSVSLERTNCEACGTPFMGGRQATVSLKVPGVGDIATLSPGGRVGFMAGAALVLMVVLFLVYLILGSLV